MATERDAKAQGFKRINFFKGFLTTEHDWNDAERYHLEKRKLQQPPLPCARHRGRLPRRRARDGGKPARRSLHGDPAWLRHRRAGERLDPVGVRRSRPSSPEEYKLPQTLYVVLRFVEELTDFIAYKENLEYKGHRRVLESCKVEVSQTEPDIRQEVELARILLEKNATRLRDARDPSDPRANEIDLRYVPRARRRRIVHGSADPSAHDRHAVVVAKGALPHGARWSAS